MLCVIQALPTVLLHAVLKKAFETFSNGWNSNMIYEKAFTTFVYSNELDYMSFIWNDVFSLMVINTIKYLP